MHLHANTEHFLLTFSVLLLPPQFAEGWGWSKECIPSTCPAAGAHSFLHSPNRCYR